MTMELDDFLSVLSRHGWDRSGPQSEKLWTFRHVMTGDENFLPPGEVPYWAADFAKKIIPAGAGDWYAQRFGAFIGLVWSRTGRRATGITHTRAGDRLIFPTLADAEVAAALLNLRDAAPRQLEMLL